MGKNFVLFLFLYMNAVGCLQRFAFSLLSGIGLCPDKHLCLSGKKVPMSAEKLCDVCRKSSLYQEKNSIASPEIHIASAKIYIAGAEIHIASAEI